MREIKYTHKTIKQMAESGKGLAVLINEMMGKNTEVDPTLATYELLKWGMEVDTIDEVTDELDKAELDMIETQQLVITALGKSVYPQLRNVNLADEMAKVKSGEGLGKQGKK